MAGDYLFISFLISVPTEMTQMTDLMKREVWAGEMARQGLAAKPDSLSSSDFQKLSSDPHMLPMALFPGWAN